jgi:hypothetical protein
LAIIPDVTSGVSGPNPDTQSSLSYWGHDPLSDYGPYEIDLTGAAFGTAVKLDIATTPSSGIAGVSYVNVTASGVPTSTIRPANLVMSFATGCGGAPVAVTTASNVVHILGTSYRFPFEMPAGLPAGAYSVGIAENGSGDANFVSGNCSELIVTN